MAAAKYSTVSELAVEFSTQAMATSMPPQSTTHLGPNLSTRYPSTGTSQVSIRTKMVKATWMAARPQWYLASMGLTKRVQPYCRFATLAMQITPSMSCTHGIANGDFAD